MKIPSALTASDERLRERLTGFVPARIFDAHAHLLNPDHFVRDNLPSSLRDVALLDLAQYRTAMARWLPGCEIDALFFGFPSRGNNRAAINSWLAEQIDGSTTHHRGLALAAPEDKPAEVACQIRQLRLVGIKPYHVYAPRADTGQAGIEEFVPEWMWEICHDLRGVLMLHIARDHAIADPDNLAALRRLCRRYPRCQVVLAHIARSFCYRHGRAGLAQLLDLDNIWLDTSAITETETLRFALETFGPRRVLYGSDFPVSELRGRCVTLGDSFFWIHPTTANLEKTVPRTDGALIGIESLLALREACEDAGLNPSDIEDLFRNNALRLLAPHLPATLIPAAAHGPELWTRAWQQISCGTNLLSKRAERYDPQTWPSYFTKCRGAYVWDITNRRYVDMLGGVGAILLGYADPDVTRAVKRRLNLGTYCSLCTPEELELAELLLALHPWAGKVRYARGGGEAMAVAVRVARAATGRSGVAFCGYHGWHDWYLAANLADDAALDGHLLPGLQPLGVPRELRGTAVPFWYNNIESFEQALRQLEGRVAAVVMEPMRSQPPRDGFLEKVARRCREVGAVLVVDEITSGWRFGFPGALPRLGIEPDIVVYAKATSNGFPFAAIVGRDTVMEAANPSFISSTYWTDGIGPAAALACIRKMQAEHVQPYVWELGGRLQQGLRAAAARYPTLKLKVEGQPSAPQIAFDLGAEAQAAYQIYVRGMLRRGYLAGGVWYVMQAHTVADVDGALTALDEVLAELVQIQTANRLLAEAGPLGGNRAAMRQGFARLA